MPEKAPENANKPTEKRSQASFQYSSEKLVREYFESLMVETRAIDAVEASTKMELFGETFSMPIMIAPMGQNALEKVYPNGVVELAKSGKAAGTPMWTGICEEEKLREAINTGAKVIKIIKPYKDTDLIFKKLEQCEKNGALAVGMDIDFIFGIQSNPGMAQTYPVSPQTLDQIKSYIKATKLPFIVKGVLSERDALKSLEAGAAGIVVSHHGGKSVESAVPPLKILPRIVELAENKIPIFADCGMTKGIDVFKALALGAKGVCLGQSVLAGLASGGADGVQKVLENINEELRRVMSFTGSIDLNHIDPDVIWGK